MNTKEETISTSPEIEIIDFVSCYDPMLVMTYREGMSTASTIAVNDFVSSQSPSFYYDKEKEYTSWSHGGCNDHSFCNHKLMLTANEKSIHATYKVAINENS